MVSLKITENVINSKVLFAILVPVYRQLRYLSFGPQNRTPKIPAGLSGVPPLFTGEKKNNQSFTLTSRPQKCSRHPATRITLNARPPPLPLPPPSVHIMGQPPSPYCRGWLSRAREAARQGSSCPSSVSWFLLMTWWGGVRFWGFNFFCEAGLFKTPASQKIEPLLG